MSTLITQLRNRWFEENAISARSYVQNGLIAMWDGIENAGNGLHRNSLNSWADLSGNGKHITMYGSVGISHDSMYFDGTGLSYFKMIDGTISENAKCLEVVFRMDEEKSMMTVACGAMLKHKAGIQLCWNKTYKYITASSMYTVNDSYTYDLPYSQNKTSISVIRDVYNEVYGFVCNGSKIIPSSTRIHNGGANGHVTIGKQTNIDGSMGAGYDMHGAIYSIRIYSRALTAAEVAHNYAIDKARFNLP